jgi:hypothetical protein
MEPARHGDAGMICLESTVYRTLVIGYAFVYFAAVPDGEQQPLVVAGSSLQDRFHNACFAGVAGMW